MIPPSRFSRPHLFSPLLSSVRVNTYLYTSSSSGYGKHGRHKVIILGSCWERPAWWLNVLRLAGVVLVFMEPLRRKKIKSWLATSCSALCACLHMRFLNRLSPFVRPPWRQSIARLAAFRPAKILRQTSDRDWRSGLASLPLFRASSRICDIEIYHRLL